MCSVPVLMLSLACFAGWVIIELDLLSEWSNKSQFVLHVVNTVAWVAAWFGVGAWLR